MKNRPKVTLICGISGSGKTYLSRRISQEEGAVRLSVDERMWSRYGRFMEFPAEEQRRLTLETEEELRGEMADYVRAGRDVVIDSCLCKRFKREAFSTVAESNGAYVERIYLTSTRDELLARLARRRGIDANDICVSEADFIRFEQNFEVPAIDEGFREIIT